MLKPSLSLEPISHHIHQGNAIIDGADVPSDHIHEMVSNRLRNIANEGPRRREHYSRLSHFKRSPRKKVES